jgi:hypothetical protein
VENGLLLTLTIEHLFDRGFIRFFKDAGRLIVSPVAHTESLRRMGIEQNSRSTSVYLVRHSELSSTTIATWFCCARYADCFHYFLFWVKK